MDRALLVGINKYPGAPLRGCINDISDMAEYLVSACGFSMRDVRLVADERATTAGILDHLNWLVGGARAGDRIFFHYSGHGAQLATRDHQGEVDGLDEVICPVDFDWTDSHVIRDKDFSRIFGAVPQGCEFIWISDSCHSGDLSKEVPPPETLWREFPVPVDMSWRYQTACDLGIKALAFNAIPVTYNNLALISGCRPDQTSADAIFDGRRNGALTYFLLKVLIDGGNNLPLGDLIENVKTEIAATQRYKQVPGVEGLPDIITRPFLVKP